ncbi:MAG TPA: LAGLIDADG family homing endonuclease [Thermoanaerobaculaceae bacterium]|nr:LAGLIDADG family homing endonuclease [Thermoanaerobaculaceae bacterium]HPS76568.1 LAGLIDADG family homing endonuclease [Thermoanaerobaculaceae bacterium]
MKPTSVGVMMINDALPEELHLKGQSLDKDTLMVLLRGVAEKHPDKYKAVLKTLNDVGRSAAYTEGVSVSLAALRKSPRERAIIDRVRKQVDALHLDPKLDHEARSAAIVKAVMPMVDELQAALKEEGTKENNPYWFQVKSGARGKISEFNAIRGAMGLVEDHRNRPVAVPILHSYAEGLDPAEYWAGTYGQRKGSIDVKFATGDAGFYNKQLVNAAHRIVVNKERPAETRVPVGLPTKVSDRDNIGAVLAMDAGPYKAGTLITSDIHADLEERGVEDILIHSPMTEITEDGGVSRWAAGRRDRAGLSPIGDNLGIPAAQGIGEKLSQGMLNCLVEGTLVRMADWSIRRIEELKVGDLVLGADAQGRTFPVAVVRTFDQGVQPAYLWEFNIGYTRERCFLGATTEHKLLANVKKYSCAGEAQNHVLQVVPVGTRAANFYAVGVKEFSAGGLLSDPRALLLGVLLGDGGYTEAAQGVHLTCADPSQIADLNTYLAPMNLVARQNPTRDIMFRLSKLNDKYQRGNPAKEMLVELGCFGKYAHDKTIPDVVYKWDNASVAALIAGLFVTDGSICLGDRTKSKMGAHYASVSRRLVEQVKELLEWRFGIHSAAITGSHVGHRRKLYQLHITAWADVQAFAKSIPLIGVKARRIVEQIRLHQPKYRTPFHLRKRRGSVKLGMKRCRDIEVDHPDHLFVLANGLIVSNSKHKAGATAGARDNRNGFAYLNRLIQAPENFPEAGPLAEDDGSVTAVTPAPQGGNYVHVGDHQYYLHAGLTPVVAKGDVLESGDDLSDGIPHPEQLVRLRGLGEARRVFADIFQEGMKNSGITVNRRNAETVVAGLLNWVKITDPDGHGDAIVDEIVPYHAVGHSYQPREGHETVAPGQARGKYLEEHALHYTPGTRVTKRVAKDLEKWKIKDVRVHAKPPSFQPYMQRGMLGVYNDPDWQTRLSGFYTTSAFTEAVHRGRESNPNSTSFIPALVQGKGFGDDLKQTGSYGHGPAPSPALPPR